MKLNDLITDKQFELLAQKLAVRVRQIMEEDKAKPPVQLSQRVISHYTTLLVQGKRKEAKMFLKAHTL